MQNHDNGTHLFNDSLVIVESVLVYIMGPNAVFIHRSLPDSFKCLVARHQGFEIGTRCNLECCMQISLWAPLDLFTAPNLGLHEIPHSCPRLSLYFVTP